MKLIIEVEVERYEGFNMSRENVSETLMEEACLDGLAFDVENDTGSVATYEVTSANWADPS